jgi:hypothetical protein
MKFRERLSVVVAIVFMEALIVGYLSGPNTTDAQISVIPTPTYTATAGAATPTDTPVPPTNTPVPPTDTPPPPTNTPTPIPPPPTLGGLSLDALEGVVEVDAPISFTTVFTDPGISTLPIVEWAWGDGSFSFCPPDSAACTISPGDGTNGTLMGNHTDIEPGFAVYTLMGNHTYVEPGVYTVQVTVRDIFGQFDTSTYEFVTVYDPAGGFVTGGGWIDSQPGAYKPDPDLAGKATFGFVSEYTKGSSRPTGNTEFQFKVADLNFHSDTYHWLVVNQDGTNAQFKGEGTINGAAASDGGLHQFMIWATDGDVSEANDTFRIKIWYEDGLSEVIVYDNGFRQPIGGGNITVYRPAKGK